MKEINLSKYSPIISDKGIGEEIYNSIRTELDKGDIVAVDMAQIRSMATFCAKQIFGKLYKEIGSESFFERLLLKNASNDLKAIIKVGIQNAIEDND